MADSLKLFVWGGEGCLENYRPGSATALAYTLDEARELVKTAVVKYYACGVEAWMDADEAKEAEVEERTKYAFLLRPPIVYEVPTALLHHGSK